MNYRVCYMAMSAFGINEEQTVFDGTLEECIEFVEEDNASEELWIEDGWGNEVNKEEW